VDEVAVVFEGWNEMQDYYSYISGSIDRMTGDTVASFTTTSKSKVIASVSYALKCRPAQRMF
jgi:hypothetical protein